MLMHMLPAFVLKLVKGSWWEKALVGTCITGFRLIICTDWQKVASGRYGYMHYWL